jgi:hypothetical protein
MNGWKHRAFIFIPRGREAAANAHAASWDLDVGGVNTFGALRLSPTGLEPFTHFGANSPATDQIKTAMTTVRTGIAGARVYFDSDGWTWQSALADSNLKVIEEPAT